MADAIVTLTARKKMVQARAGEIALPTIKGFAFGDGAIEEAGSVIRPKETDIGLKHELLRKVIDGYQRVTETKYRYECTLLNSDLANENINEIALYDSDGDILAIKAFKNKGKDDDLEMTFMIDDAF